MTTAVVTPLRWVRIRLVSTGVVFGLLLCGMVYRAWHLQVRQAPKLRAMAEEQYLKEIEVGIHRGTIFDRHGAVLAQSVEVDSVYANPRQLSGDLRETASVLATALHADPNDIYNRLRPRRYFAWVKRRVSPDEARAVRELGIVGVGVTTEPRRFYPNQQLAGPVLGHAGIDGRGLEGVELGLDRSLRGARRTVAGLRDALGREVLMAGLPQREPDTGHDVVLTIDKFVQFAAERALAEAIDKHHAKAGMVIVLDPRTGDVLAMATSPTYDPNRPASAGKKGARNRAVTDPYEPGSTMKVFSVAAALDAGVIRANESWHCEHGRFKIGKYTIHDAHPQGVLSTAEVIQKSSNIGATKIARRLGKERLHEGLLRFGFGRQTGVGLPGERAGRIRAASRWGEIGLATVSFGQGLTATPLQLVAALGAIGNGGVYHPPRVVRAVRDAQGQVVSTPKGTARQVMRPAAARQMVEMLKLVTRKGGTAVAAAVPGFEVGGKTGTAQKVDPGSGHYSRDNVVASFMGIVPADDPKLAMLVIIDEPQGDHYGGLVAGPVFKRVAEEALRYLGATANPAIAGAADAARSTIAEGTPGIAEVAPELEPESPATATAAAAAASPGDDEDEPAPAAQADDESDEPALPEPPALEALEEPASAPVAPAGESESAPAASPWPAGAELAAVVPDFGGMSIGQALAAARRAGVRLELRGSGRAFSQSLRPGPAPRGAVCRVTFGVAP